MLSLLFSTSAKLFFSEGSPKNNLVFYEIFCNRFSCGEIVLYPLSLYRGSCGTICQNRLRGVLIMSLTKSDNINPPGSHAENLFVSAQMSSIILNIGENFVRQVQRAVRLLTATAGRWGITGITSVVLYYPTFRANRLVCIAIVAQLARER